MNGGEYEGVWVYSEVPALAYELLGKGRELADSLGAELSALCLGYNAREECRNLIAHGADKVYLVDHPLLERFHFSPYADAIAELAMAYRPAILLVGATKNGLEVAPRVAERLKTGCCTECIRLQLDAEKRHLLMDRLVLGGNVVETRIVRTMPQMATIPRGLFRPLPRDGSRRGEVVEFQPKIDEPAVKVLEKRVKQAAGVKIAEAEVIVSFGRGVRRREDVKIIEELASTIGGAVGCSRPMAEDLKWLPQEQYIGLSGQKVSPKLYIACGISGQIQHLTGIRNARIIVAINLDPRAPIFEHADYCILGDLYEVVPALTRAFKRFLKK